MLHTNNQIIKHKVGLLNLAEELQNVSRACKVMGVSRDTFYRYQELVKSGDIDALINKSRRVPNLKNRVDDATEHQLLISQFNIPHMVSTVLVMNYARRVYSFQGVGFALYGFVMI